MDERLNLGVLLSVLWRGKLRILLCVAMISGLGALYAFRIAVPTYVATTSIVLDTRSAQILDVEGVLSGLSGDATDVNTQVQILRSHSLLGRVVDALSLETVPDFNDDLRTPLIPQAWRDWIMPLQEASGGVSTPQATRQMAVDALFDRLNVRNIPQSLVFQITVETEDSGLSASISDTLADIYIRDQQDVKLDATRQATEWLGARLTELQAELEAAETAVKDFIGQTDLVSAEALLDLQRQLKAQRHRISQARDALGANAPAQSRAQRQLASLEDGQQRLERQISAQSQDLIRLEQLEREAEATRSQYAYFLNRFKETSVQEGIQRPDSRILSKAVVPNQSASPRHGLIILLCVVLGGFVGSVWALVRERNQNGYRSGLQLEIETGVSVLGQIPKARRRSRKALVKLLRRKDSSAFGEAIRNLRTSLLATKLADPPRIIVLTSSVPSEGKTTQSIALASNLAALGRRVLLIEGDVRRRVFDNYFEVKGRAGIMTALTGRTPVEELVHNDAELGIDVLVGEPSPMNAADVFESSRFGDLIASLREVYDHVVIDTPPVLAVPDARVIGRHADAILYVVKWDQTGAAQVHEGLSQLGSAGLNVDGLILSQIDAKGMKRYGLSGTYGAHGYGYYEARG
jgi:succinoglycan biosynthesis transport protein ExoP